MAIYDSEGTEIPDAPFYVTTTDKFMSGWGRADGKKNKLVFPAESYEEAEIVADNARARSDQNYVNINIRKPSYELDQYYVQVKTKADYPHWYEKGYFKERG